MNTFQYLSAAALCAAAFTAQAQVGVSVSVNDPGLYGRVDINEAPPPEALVYGQPVVIAPSSYAVARRPIYLHVPLGYERDWAQRCNLYGACGQPVYFVRDDYYRGHYYHPVARAVVRHDIRHDVRHDVRHDRRDDRRDHR